MHFSLKQLEVFLAVANHENVSVAARELAMSQSAASTALKELEQRFELQLFDRIGKRLQLNEAGSALRRRAAAVHEAENEGLAQVEGVEADGSLQHTRVSGVDACQTLRAVGRQRQAPPSVGSL